VLKIVKEGSGRMPGFAHLDDAERGGALRYILAPEPVIDDPRTEVTYVLGGYVYLRDHENLPGNTPPWGTLNSIDLASGEIVWKIPFGNYPTHPELGFGSVNYGGPVVTASGLIFIAATPDKKFRAYDNRDGKVLWETELSAAGFATPAVYSVDGKQYVVIAAGGGRMGPPSGSEYFAFSLPPTP
jgi:quinoprotein glucose dehydrogenase